MTKNGRLQAATLPASGFWNSRSLSAVAELVILTAIGLAFGGRSAAQDSAAPDSPTINSAVATNQQPVVPRLMKFNGVLRDPTGKPLSGAVEVTFALYGTETGGEVLWFETQSVQADDQGRYTALLGAMHTEGLPVDLFTSGEARWLGVQVGREAEQKPRVLLLSVPYALKASDAETLGGKPASAFVQTEAGGAAGAGASSTGGTASSGENAGKNARDGKSTTKKTNAPASCSSVTSDGSAPTNSVAKFTTACNIENSAITEVGGLVGIGTTTPTTALTVQTGSGYGIMHTDGTRKLATYINPSGGWVGTASNHPLFFFTNGGNPQLTLLPNGNVGIGTGTPISGLTLQTGPGYGFTHTDGTRTLATYITPSGGWVGTASNHPLFFFTNGGNPQLTLLPNGKLGIGTASPAATLDVAGTINASTSSGTPVQGQSTSTSGTPLGVLGTSNPASTFGAGVSGIGGAASTYSLSEINNAGLRVGVWGNSYGGITNMAVLGTSDDGFGTVGRSRSSTAVQGETYTGLAGDFNRFNGTGTILKVRSGSSTRFSVDSNGTVYATGPLGVGTAAPSQALEVIGNIKVTGTGNGITFPDGTTQTTAGGGGGVTSFNGRTGAVTPQAGDYIAFYAPASGSASYVAKAGDTMTGALNLPTDGLVVGTNELVTTGGKVGIGTASPSVTLDVAGTINASTSSGTPVQGQSTSTSGTPLGVLGTSNPASTFGAGVSGIGGAASTYSLSEINNAGLRVGVWGNSYGGIYNMAVLGTSDDGFGTVGRSRSGTAVQGETYTGLAGDFNRFNGTGTILIARNGSSTRFSVDSNGTTYATGPLGVGTSTPATTLQVLGDIRVGTSGTNGCVQNFAGSAIAGTCSSDARLKRDVQAFPPTLHKLVQLTAVDFYWRADQFPERHFGSSRSYGLIAQEVEKVFPEMVSRDGQGYKTVDYTRLPLLLLQAVRELKAENEGLREQMQSKVRRQAEELESLKAELKQARSAGQAETAKLQSQLTDERNERHDQQAELSQVLAQLRVIQARLVGRASRLPGVRTANASAVPAKTPDAPRPNTKGAVNPLAERVSF
jgi:hypothetical protein